MRFGNASAIDRRRGIVAIKPSGVDYDSLRPSDIVLVDLDGKTVEGKLRPSSDTPTHLELYRAFSAIGGIVHVHSPFATAFSQACLPIPALGTTHADFFRGAVPVTRPLSTREIDGDYEVETGRAIVEAFRLLDPTEVPAVLVCRHAPFTWGATVADAVENALALELCAGIAAKSLELNPALVGMGPALLDRHFFRKHGPKATYGQRTPNKR
jgi:L-ribulose-5-phosphate 4-epimerase